LPLSFLLFFSFSLLLLLLFSGIRPIWLWKEMIMKTFRCACCKRIRPRNLRVKNQRYCGERRCQQERKNRWQREKEQDDPAYRANKRESHRAWRKKNPNYWRLYRRQHPEYCERNRRLQCQRDRHRICDNASSHVDLANPDTLTVYFNDTTDTYLLFPANMDLANQDALAVKIFPISTG